MRKKTFGKQLKRDTNERQALFKSLMHELVLHETIITTEAKAKSVRGQVEKFVTKAKKNPAEAMRTLQSHFAIQTLTKLVNEIAPRFVGRSGGYTRIVRIGNRVNDNAKIVMLEWIEKGGGRSKIKKAEADTEMLEATAKTGKAPAKKKTEKVKKETKSSKEKDTKKKVKAKKK